MIRRLCIYLCFFRAVNAVFHVANNTLYYNYQSYKIKGINWFGMETSCLCPHGLWMHDTEYYMNIIRNYEFNSIRIPFSYEMVMSLSQKLDYECVKADPYINSMSTGDYLHHLFYHASIRGITILLDFHRDHDIIQPYPLSRISQDEFFQAWKIMLTEYGSYTNLIGIDIKNEPHGGITWLEWSSFVNSFIQFVEVEIPDYKGLYWVEGIEEPSDYSAWGGSFSKMETHLGQNPNIRIVFSPHVYGVSVRGINSINDNSYEWNTWFGFLPQYYDNLLCIGEIGGFNGGSDYTWHQNILAYLQSNSIHNFYYWCLNPDSGDTGGVLGPDWTTIDQSKIDFCYNLQPHPTFLQF